MAIIASSAIPSGVSSTLPRSSYDENLHPFQKPAGGIESPLQKLWVWMRRRFGFGWPSKAWEDVQIRDDQLLPRQLLGKVHKGGLGGSLAWMSLHAQEMRILLKLHSARLHGVACFLDLLGVSHKLRDVQRVIPKKETTAASWLWMLRKRDKVQKLPQMQISIQVERSGVSPESRMPVRGCSVP